MAADGRDPRPGVIAPGSLCWPAYGAAGGQHGHAAPAGILPRQPGPFFEQLFDWPVRGPMCPADGLTGCPGDIGLGRPSWSVYGHARAPESGTAADYPVQPTVTRLPATQL
jgi:hypothetical protein